jgi:excisionase family DNA binding protein
MSVNLEQSLSPPAPGSPKRGGFATPAEAAHFLSLSKAMIHKLINADQMPAARYGRAVRIPWAWLEAQGQGTHRAPSASQE